MERKNSLTVDEVKEIIEKIVKCPSCFEILQYVLEHALRGTELGIHFSKEHSGEYHIHHGGGS